MYQVLNKDIITMEILPLIPRNIKLSSNISSFRRINCILYKLKTGVQWEYLPVKSLFSGKVQLQNCFWSLL